SSSTTLPLTVIVGTPCNSPQVTAPASAGATSEWIVSPGPSAETTTLPGGTLRMMNRPESDVVKRAGSGLPEASKYLTTPTPGSTLIAAPARGQVGSGPWQFASAFRTLPRTIPRD